MGRQRRPEFNRFTNRQLRAVVESALEAQTTTNLPYLKTLPDDIPARELREEEVTARRALFRSRLEHAGIPNDPQARKRTDELYGRLADDPRGLVGELAGHGVVLPEPVLMRIQRLPGYSKSVTDIDPSTPSAQSLLEGLSVTASVSEFRNGRYEPLEPGIALEAGALVEGVEVPTPETPEALAKQLGCFELDDHGLVFRAAPGRNFHMKRTVIFSDRHSVTNPDQEAEGGRHLLIARRDADKAHSVTLSSVDVVERSGSASKTAAIPRFRINVEAVKRKG